MDSIDGFYIYSSQDLRDAFLMIEKRIGWRFGSISLSMDSNHDFAVEVFVKGTIGREPEIYGPYGGTPKVALQLFMDDIDREEEYTWTPWWREDGIT